MLKLQIRRRSLIVKATIRGVRSTVSVTREQRIAASRADVWKVIADPCVQARLDSRCRLESATGDWRAAGSEFVLIVRGNRLRYVVVEADAGIEWVAKVDRRGQPVAIQRGELVEDRMGTLVRWTVTVSAGRLMRPLAKRSCERELPRWLAAVEREVLANV